MNRKEDWQKVREYIEKGERFTLTTHVNPDGDGIGCEIALYYFLKSLNKKVKIINHSLTPQNYQFLDPDYKLIESYSKKSKDWILNSDVIIILDISTKERLGDLKNCVDESNAYIICFDHHASNDSFSDLNLIDINACATGELIYDFISQYNNKFTLKIAEALYITILTDTGSFRFSNSSVRSHIIAAELIKMGVKPREMYEKTYETTPWEKIFLFQKALSTLRKEANGKIASMYITESMLNETGASREDIEGFVDYLNIIKDVDTALLFIETPKNGVKVSLRSKENTDVNKIAELFGGGGHYHASGIILRNITVENAMKKVIKTVEENITENSNEDKDTST